MNPAINPFAALIAQVAAARSPRVCKRGAQAREQPATKTGAMREHLKRAGRATAADLAIEAEVTGNTGLVFALLKADLAKGAILRDGRFYVWNQEFDESQHEHIQEAIRTLRAAGYTVTRKTP